MTGNKNSGRKPKPDDEKYRSEPSFERITISVPKAIAEKWKTEVRLSKPATTISKYIVINMERPDNASVTALIQNIKKWYYSRDLNITKLEEEISKLRESQNSLKNEIESWGIKL